jgi:hypothetical protein
LTESEVPILVQNSPNMLALINPVSKVFILSMLPDDTEPPVHGPSHPHHRPHRGDDCGPDGAIRDRGMVGKHALR